MALYLWWPTPWLTYWWLNQGSPELRAWATEPSVKSWSCNRIISCVDQKQVGTCNVQWVTHPRSWRLNLVLHMEFSSQFCCWCECQKRIHLSLPLLYWLCSANRSKSTQVLWLPLTQVATMEYTQGARLVSKKLPFLQSHFDVINLFNGFWNHSHREKLHPSDWQQNWAPVTKMYPFLKNPHNN